MADWWNPFSWGQQQSKPESWDSAQRRLNPSNTALGVQIGGTGAAGVGNYSGPARVAGSSPGAAVPGYDFAANQATLNSLNAELAALRAQVAAQPRLLNFNSTDAWSRARAQAEAQVTPYYQAKINNLVAQLNVKRQNEQNTASTSTASLETGLQNTLEDIATNRQRTGEDVQQNIENIGNQEQQFQQDTGQQFDTQRQQTAANAAEAGLATSGIGRQVIGQQQQQRNIQEGRQEQQFQLQNKLQQQFKNRTFADLATKENRSTEQTKFQKEGVQFNLNQAMTQLGLEEEQSRRQNEYERLNDIVGKSGQAYNSILGEFLNSQIKSGARAQDIQATKQAYGI